MAKFGGGIPGGIPGGGIIGGRWKQDIVLLHSSQLLHNIVKHLNLEKANLKSTKQIKIQISIILWEFP